MTDAPSSLSRRRLLRAGAAFGFASLAPLLRGSRPLSSLLTPQEAMADTPATIALGDPKNFDLRAPGSRLDRLPVGMHFYKRKWPLGALGTVRYLQGPHSFDIPRVSSVMGASDPAIPEEGIYSWGIGAFAMDGERVAHAIARDRLFELFENLLRAGWQRFVLPSEPRLAQAEALRYVLSCKGNYPPDPRYVPTLDEWMQLNLHLPYWQFWADGVYMDVRVIDEPALRDPKGVGVYMFSIDLEGETPHFWKYFDEVEDMKRWKELIPAELQIDGRERARSEARLRLQGYTIDETYRDPPVLALGDKA
jgi:hypothetical protein